MSEEPNMQERAKGFKKIFETVQEEYQTDINPTVLEDEVLVHVSVVTEWVDPYTGNRRLLDHHIGSGGDRMAPAWQAKGVLMDSLAQYDKVRGRA
jgi:hypothetical protein